MGGPAFDVVSNPLGAVRQLFERAKETSKGETSALSAGDWGVTDLFAKAVSQESVARMIPALSASTLSQCCETGRLVRFCAMVQDMRDTEFYQGLYKAEDGTLKTSKFQDKLEGAPLKGEAPKELSSGWGSGSAADSVANSVWERQVFFCTSIPGIQPWARLSLLSSSGDSKEGGPSTAQGCGCPQGGGDHASEMEMDAQGSPVGMGGHDASLEPDTKRHRSEGPGSGSCDIFVKVYGAESSSLKLNDTAEFFGVVSMKQTWEVDGETEGPKVPTLHCMLFRHLPSLFPSPSSTLDPLPSLRSSLLLSLSKSLGGDALAAEYFLLHLLSKVHSRVEPMALGKLSLNLIKGGATGGAVSFADAATSAVQALMPVAVSLNLHCADISTRRLTPYKDYDQNKLVSSPLQLPLGAHLTVNETTLEPGMVSELGVANVKALCDLARWQKVPYDFQFYKVDMNANVSFLVLSQARSRMLVTDVTLPLAGAGDCQLFSGSPGELDAWRQYLGVARAMEHSISNDMQDFIEKELVTARQNDRTLGQDAFHRWLTTARLLAASHGSPELRKEHWESMRQLERTMGEQMSAL